MPDADGYPVDGDVMKNEATGETRIMKNGVWTSGGVQARALPSTAEQATSAKRNEGLATSADIIGGLSQQANEVMQKNARVKTGGVYGLPLGLGHVPLALAELMPGNHDLKDMDASSVSMAKNLRAQGQRLTQMEWLKNLGSVPSPTNTEEANRDIARDYSRANVQEQAKNSFFQSWMAAHGSDAGADAAWLSFKQKHFDTNGNWAGGAMSKLDPNTPGNAPANPAAGWKVVQ